MLKDDLDQLIEIATSDKYAIDVLAARKEYQNIAGNIYEDDKSYDNRMALFLEWYIFDRILPNKDQTLIEIIIDENWGNWPSNQLQIFEGFTKNIHGLFTVKKIKDNYVKVLNLFNNERYQVNETLGKLLFSKNGIFEGRLVPYRNMYYFSGSFCFHSEKTRNFIKQKIKQVKVIQRGYKKEVKNKTTQLNTENKKLTKINSKINSLKVRLLKLHSENKILKIKKHLVELEIQRSDSERRFSFIESEVTKFTHEKIFRGEKALQIKLIQKLSYMQLVWERSRLIDINDIYHN